jgi:hypothetical protein
MEVKIEVNYENINDNFSRESDDLFREIFKKFPKSTWQREGPGYKILI